MHGGGLLLETEPHSLNHERYYSKALMSPISKICSERGVYNEYLKRKETDVKIMRNSNNELNEIIDSHSTMREYCEESSVSTKATFSRNFVCDQWLRSASLRTPDSLILSSRSRRRGTKMDSETRNKTLSDLFLEQKELQRESNSALPSYNALLNEVDEWHAKISTRYDSIDNQLYNNNCLALLQ